VFASGSGPSYPSLTMRRLVVCASVPLFASCLVSIGNTEGGSGAAAGSGAATSSGGGGGAGASANAGSGGEPDAGSGGTMGGAGGSAGVASGGTAGSAPKLVFADDFSSGIVNWAGLGDGGWTVVDGAAQQSNANATSGILYAKTVNEKKVRFVSNAKLLISTAIDSAYELLVGGTFAGSPSYHNCAWEPVQRRMLLRTRDGQSVTALGEYFVPEPDGYDATATVTMELVMDGSSMTCKVHEVPGAELSKPITVSLAGGGIGFKIWKASVSFDNVFVYQL
jgi:hypothetical protein